MAEGTPSKTQTDKAGALLRDWFPTRASTGVTPEVDEATEIVWAYRSAFNQPLTRVNVNVRHYIRTADCDIVVAQRLKRLPRIVEKLVRYPRMRLTQMQDVGGCRAILPDQDSVNAVYAGLSKNWEIADVDDYVTNPKADGYRAIHVMVRRSGYIVELQLRTVGQQDWADEVEGIDSLVPYALKDGDGPEESLDYLRRLAEVIAVREVGGLPTDTELRALSRLRSRVRESL